MKKVMLTKKGIGTVVFTTTDDGKFIVTVNGIDMPVTKEAGNATYMAYRNAGWSIKEQAEKKAAAPKPEKKKTERFIWGPETRKIWAVEFNRRKRLGIEAIKNLKGDEYRKARQELEATLKAEMKVWEAENAAQVNLEVLQRRAEKDAING